jgi:GLPGLI family protein
MHLRLSATAVLYLVIVSTVLAQKPFSGVLQYTLSFTDTPGHTQRSNYRLVYQGDESAVTTTTKPSSATTFSTVQYKNFRTKKLISQGDADGEPIIVDEILKPIAWKILPQTRKFGEYTCQKARATIRGRTYTAWFTKQIAISTGPWKLYGLPGLILEAEDDTHEVKFAFTSLTASLPKNVSIKPPVPAAGQKRMTAAGRDTYVAQKYEAIRKQLSSKPGFSNTVVEINPGKTIELAN